MELIAALLLIAFIGASAIFFGADSRPADGCDGWLGRGDRHCG